MEHISSPIATRSVFSELIDKCVSEFPSNRFCKKVDSGDLKMSDYHSLLKVLFHQVYFSSNSFALAGSQLGLSRSHARDYLFHHAEEEKTHWTWILNDLKATSYVGPDLRTVFPDPSTHAYIAFNFFIAEQQPIARLGIALMLESLGATYGKQYATKLCKSLGLEGSQASFFFGHGDTDIEHTKDLWAILDSSEVSPVEWGWMCQAARVAWHLYSRMYEEC